MKKTFTILILTAFLSLNYFNANAKVWRLNNSGANADFNNWTAAYNGASAGDTIYVESSPTSYGDFSLSKPLTLIGTGYFLQENLPTQFKNIWNATCHEVSFELGSEGSCFYGFTIGYAINIDCGNIIISRNKINNIAFGGGTNFSNIKISQNYIGYISSGATNTISNVLINNNFIYIDFGLPNWYLYEYEMDPYAVINLQANITGSIINNIIVGYGVFLQYFYPNNGNSISNQWHYCPATKVSGFFIVNNIIKQGSIANSSLNICSNNICNSTQLTVTDGNQANVDMSTVFVGSGSTDGQWKLKEGSPAIGAGLGGVDCGMFGGSEPYVLSGMPSIPAVYNIVMPTSVVGNNNLHVTVSAKAH